MKFWQNGLLKKFCKGYYEGILSLSLSARIMQQPFNFIEFSLCISLSGSIHILIAAQT